MMRSVLDMLLYPFAWRMVRDTGAHTYWVNDRSAKRRVIQTSSGYQPIDRRWLGTGEWEFPPPPEGTCGRCGAESERRVCDACSLIGKRPNYNGPPPLRAKVPPSKCQPSPPPPPKR